MWGRGVSLDTVHPFLLRLSETREPQNLLLSICLSEIGVRKDHRGIKIFGLTPSICNDCLKRLPPAIFVSFVPPHRDMLKSHLMYGISYIGVVFRI